MNAKAPDRFQLLTLLSEACELEHGLACCYLYAACSLKQDLVEGGLSWQQLEQVRLWASQVFHVAAEEMLHLAQAWNLLTAIGGTPWYSRPNFPQSARYYALHLPLETKPFSLETLERFITFEHPHDPTAKPPRVHPGDEAPTFRNVGELYMRIAEYIRALPEHELFIGNSEHQVGPDLVDFPDLKAVSGQKTALAAIEMITEQGEGTKPDSKDSHYEIFRGVRASFLEQTLDAARTGAAFEPVRPCISNPIAYQHEYLAAPGANPIANPHTAKVADALNATYMLMLRLLQYVFDSATGDDRDALQPFADAALQLMTTVIKPLGEALTCMPAGARYRHATAGPPFTIGRNVPLPLSPAIARTVATEKLAQLKQTLTALAADSKQPAQLLNAAANIQHVTIEPAATPVR
jgi:Ferritin-like